MLFRWVIKDWVWLVAIVALASTIVYLELRVGDLERASGALMKMAEMHRR